ncbi:uncharacterized protein QRFP [Latimeria chalumnae]|nr:PREDICTED: uncharacterized protein LOC106704457 [Latimeria chalumnae]|eukprot:XP_014347024.1 PREDICTED: uncharacterized protein LOC106704457 [Latimeria chalumnae]
MHFQMKTSFLIYPLAFVFLGCLPLSSTQDFLEYQDLLGKISPLNSLSDDLENWHSMAAQTIQEQAASAGLSLGQPGPGDQEEASSSPSGRAEDKRLLHNEVEEQPVGSMDLLARYFLGRDKNEVALSTPVSVEDKRNQALTSTADGLRFFNRQKGGFGFRFGK